MAEKRRPYDATRRQQQARRTRLRVLEAGFELFVEHGYVTATIRAIAHRAQVVPDTVYKTFGSKRAVLAAVLDWKITDSPDPTSLLDEPDAQQMRAETSPSRQVETFAVGAVEVLERSLDIEAVLRSAATVDDDLADLRTSRQDTRLERITTAMGWIAARGGLRDGITTGEAGTVAWTLASPEVYGLLRQQRGWPPDQIQRWLSDTLRRTLLTAEEIGLGNEASPDGNWHL